jgi:hypothetical protein
MRDGRIVKTGDLIRGPQFIGKLPLEEIKIAFVGSLS